MHSIELESISNNLQEKIEVAILLSKNITILTHSNADPDALGSACALANLISMMNPTANIRIVISDGVGSECRELFKACIERKIEIEIIKKSKPMERGVEDSCILVDVASTEQLKHAKAILTVCKNIIIIDHHEAREYEEYLLEGRNVIYVLDSTASSTAEIVYKLIKEFGIEIDSDSLKFLLAGIIWDTKRFLRISQNTFKYVTEIIEKGINYNDVLKIIESPKPLYSKIARIKCLLRHRGFKAVIDGKEFYIAISEVGAYESDCATALITMGYDVAIVINVDESLKIMRLIYRIRENLVEELQIDIYKAVLKGLVNMFGGGGGGHKGAGGVILRTINVKAVVGEIIEILKTLSGNNLSEFIEEKVR